MFAKYRKMKKNPPAWLKDMEDSGKEILPGLAGFTGFGVITAVVRKITQKYQKTGTLTPHLETLILVASWISVLFVFSKVKSLKPYRGGVLAGATAHALVTLLPRYMGGLSPMLGLPAAGAAPLSIPPPPASGSKVLQEYVDDEDPDLEDLSDITEGWKFH